MISRLWIAGVYAVWAAGLGGCFAEGEVEGPMTEYDTSRPYYLPWEGGVALGIIQSFDGEFGHASNHLAHDEYAIDVKMPEGTYILAARDGTVAFGGVEDSHDASCPSRQDCENNYIAIDHIDGSQGVYLHILNGGACVLEGETIQRGDVIAYSGNVGISATPHLHFHVAGSSHPPAFVEVDEGGTGVPRGDESVMPMYYSANAMGRDFCLERNPR